MESFTKVKLNETQLRLLAESTFGPGTAIVSVNELTGVFFNTAYDLELNNGKSVILKVAPAEETQILSYEKDILRTEVEALRLIGAAGTVPVPEVYGFDDSKERIPCLYFFMEKIEGQPYSEIKERLSPEERASIEYNIGKYQRAINEIKGERFGLFGQLQTGNGQSWRETFASMFRVLLADADRLEARLPVSSDELYREIEKYLPELDAVTEPRLVHWDLWNGNVFVKNGKIVSVIDWERALWGDVLMEYYFRHFENSQAFIKGYAISFDSPNELARIKLYDLYLDLILMIECYSRQYKDEGHVRWASDNLQHSWQQFISGTTAEV